MSQYIIKTLDNNSIISIETEYNSDTEIELKNIDDDLTYSSDDSTELNVEPYIRDNNSNYYSNNIIRNGIIELYLICYILIIIIIIVILVIFL